MTRHRDDWPWVLACLMFLWVLLAIGRIQELERGSAFTEIARQRDACDTERADLQEKVYQQALESQKK